MILACQRPVGALEGFGEMIIRIVNVDNVHVIELQPPQAALCQDAQRGL